MLWITLGSCLGHKRAIFWQVLLYLCKHLLERVQIFIEIFAWPTKEYCEILVDWDHIWEKLRQCFFTLLLLLVLNCSIFHRIVLRSHQKITMKCSIIWKSWQFFCLTRAPISYFYCIFASIAWGCQNVHWKVMQG